MHAPVQSSHAASLNALSRATAWRKSTRSKMTRRTDLRMCHSGRYNCEKTHGTTHVNVAGMPTERAAGGLVVQVGMDAPDLRSGASDFESPATMAPVRKYGYPINGQGLRPSRQVEQPPKDHCSARQPQFETPSTLLLTCQKCYAACRQAVRPTWGAMACVSKTTYADRQATKDTRQEVTCATEESLQRQRLTR